MAQLGADAGRGRAIGRLVLAACIAAPLLRFALDAARGIDYLHVQYLVDDAFYYFVIARHFPEFNPGIASSGFHPLYALLASLFQPRFEPATAILCCLAVLALANSACVLVLYRCVNRVAPRSVALLCAMGWAANAKIHALAMTGVETMLAVFAVLLFFERFTRVVADNATGQIRAMAVLGACSGLAFWARMDAPLWLAPAAVVVVATALRDRSFRAASAFAVTAAGLPLVWIGYMLVLTGSAFPTSGAALRVLRAANHTHSSGVDGWVTTAGVALGYFNQYFAGGRAPLWLLVTGIGVLCAVVHVRSAREPSGLGRLAAVVGLGAVVWAAYYVFDLGGFRIWYGLYLAIPVYLLCVPLLARAIGSVVPNDRVALALTAVGVLGFSMTSSGGPIAPHEFDKYQAALAANEVLRDLPATAKIGSFNAGVYNFYTDREVINLDGVVNPRALAAHRDGDIAGYMRELGIEYLIEHDATRSATFRRVFHDPALHFQRVTELTGRPFAGRVFKRTWLWKVSYPN
jgi:hypothetical protein